MTKDSREPYPQTQLANRLVYPAWVLNRGKSPYTLRTLASETIAAIDIDPSDGAVRYRLYAATIIASDRTLSAAGYSASVAEAKLHALERLQRFGFEIPSDFMELNRRAAKRAETERCLAALAAVSEWERQAAKLRAHLLLNEQIATK